MDYFEVLIFVQICFGFNKKNFICNTFICIYSFSGKKNVYYIFHVCVLLWRSHNEFKFLMKYYTCYPDICMLFVLVPNAIYNVLNF